MIANKILTSAEREKIFSLFLKNQRMKFTDLERCTNLRSNLIAYHLKKLIEGNLILKKGDYYVLTSDAERLIPTFPENSVSALPIVLVAIVKNSKILLMKRSKRPYKDYWGVIGGKMLLDETIKSAALRLVKEKTCLDVKYLSLNAVMHERVREKTEIKHGFVLFFTKALADNLSFRETVHGKLKWFSLKKVRSKIIPSDLWLIKHALNKKTEVKEALINASGKKLKSIKFLRD